MTDSVIQIDSRADRDEIRRLVSNAQVHPIPPLSGRERSSPPLIRGGREGLHLLPDYITARLSTPFAWGSHDCVCFAIGWLSIVAGRDLLAPFGTWHDERSAARAIKKYGGIEKQFDLHLKRIASAHYAKDGDVTLVDGTAYLFSGPQIVGPGKHGLIFKSRMEAVSAWTSK